MKKRFLLSLLLSFFLAITAFSQPGNALNFDGVDDYASVPNSTAFNVSKFTIETWVYWTPTANTDIQFITSKGDALMELHTGGGGANGLRFIPRPGLYLDAAGVLPTNRWTHIAAMYNPDNLSAKLYINGVEVTLVRDNASYANIGDIITTSNNYLNIGSRYDLSYKFKGSIDELRVFADSRTAAEVKTDMLSSFTTMPSSLFAYYKFDAGTAGASNTGVTTLANLGTASGLGGIIYNFALTGSTSNWIESYAMMATTATAATAYTANGFTANWTAPTAGTVDNYLLDISTSSDFSSFVSGYNSFSVAGSNTSHVVTGLSAPNNYYRVRANKTSVPNQGWSLNSIFAINPNSDAFLNNLSSNTGAFNTSFSSATTAYSKTVIYSVNSTTVTPTLSNSSATMEIRLNGGSYTSINNATPSTPLNLNIGANTIDIRVTALNGTTQNIYTLTVTRGNPAPSISSAVYDITTGVLTATGVDFLATAGANNDIDISKFTISGQAGATYTLTTSNVDITDATHFSVTLNATDKAGILTLLNKNGTTANDGTVYNISAAADWMVNQPGNADLTGNAITVSNAATITTMGMLTTFNACPSFNSAAQNFTVSGTALTANILLTAPAGYEISTSSGSGYANSLSLTQLSGVVSNTIIYARLTTTATGSPMGNITAASTNAITQNKGVSGFVNPFPAPFATKVQVYAGTATVAALTATGSSIQWYAAASGGTALLNTTPLVNGTVYYASQSAGGCESVIRFAVTAKQISNASQAFCNSGTVANLTSTPMAGATAAWYAAATGGTALANTAALSTGTYYIEQQKALSTIDFNMGGTSPVALAVQPDGKVVFSNTDGTIKRMNADGSGEITLATGLGDIFGIAIQADGKILVTDALNTDVKRMNADGTGLDTLASGFNIPYGIAIQADGKILVADAGNYHIKRLNTDGSLNATLAGGLGMQPVGIALQADGKIVVADAISSSVKRINADGTNLVILRSGLNNPATVAIEADGKILISNNSNKLLRMDADGANLVEITDGLSTQMGVAVQTDGKILVADRTSNRIQQISAASNSNRVAVAITVNNTSAPTGIASQVYAGTATLANLTATGSNIQWYAAATGGTALANTTALVNGSSYYASQTANSCESVTRFAVGVQQISASSATKCANETVASLSSSATAGFVPVWYGSASGGSALANTSLLSTGNYYIEQQQSINNSTDIGSFSNPFGVRAQADGKVLVTDMGTSKLYRMDVNGANRVELASGFNLPSGITVQADGKIYVADVSNNIVKRFNADGSNMVLLGAGLSNPTAIAIEANGKILILSSDAITRMDADGSNQAIIVSGLISPGDIALQADGKILIADYNNNAIKRYNADGSNMVVLGSGFNKPSGVAIQPDGKILVADRFNNQIKRMDANGANIEVLGSGINRPLSVAIHPDGSILVGNQAAANIIRIVETGATSSNRIPVAVTVNSLPVVSITGSTSIAVNANAGLSPVSGGVWASNNTAVATVTNAGAITGVAIGSTTFAFTETNTGCTSLPTASFTVAPPTIASATYNVTTGELVVTGNYFASTSGANNDIDISKITITGQNASTYTLTSSNVEISSSTSFSISLNATDKAALISVLNKNGSISHSSSAYNIGAAANWNAAASGNADLTGNAITVSNAINITTTASLTAMTAIYGSASTTQNFTVSGVSLTNNIVITPPSGFEVSINAASSYDALVSLSPVAGTVNATTIYIRLKANNTVAGSPYMGNIVVSSTNALSQNIAIANSTVSPAALTITASAVNKTYGQILTGATGSTAFTSVGLVGTETIGTVTVGYGTGSAATAAAGTYTGSVTPSAATGGTFTAGNYNITYATGNIIVGRAALTITASAVNKMYGQALTGAAGSTAFTSVGLLNGETIGTVNIAYGTGSAATAPEGTYTGSVIPSAALGGTFTASNYTISYTTGNIIVGRATLTVTASVANKTYGQILTGAAGSTAFTSVGLLNGETIGTVNIAYGTGSAANANVGTYTGSVIPSAALGGTFTASNYNITYAAGNIIVGQATLTITASAVNKTYGQILTGAAGSTAFTSVGLVGTETIGTVTVAYGTGAAANANVGTYTGSVTPSAAAGGTFTTSNYNITYAAGSIIVGQAALTITASAVNKTYGQILTGATGSTAFTSVGLVGTETIGTVTVAYGTGAAANANVGTYTGSVTPSAATGGTFTTSNYNITYAAGNIIVGQAALTITASAANKTYGQALIGAAGSTAFTSVGLLNGETIGTVTVAYSTGSAANANVGTYTGSVTPSAATGGTFTAGNYNITYAAGNIVISKSNLTITGITASNKVYDANTVATVTGNPVLVGLIGSDNLSVGGTIVASFNNSSVGVNKPVSLSGYMLIGNAAANYTLIQPTGFSANITPKLLTISGVSANNKKFDGNTTAILSGTAVLNGVVGNDNITLVGNPVALFASSSVGTNIVVTVTGYSISGLASGNYTLSVPLLFSADISLDAPIVLSNNADLSTLTTTAGILSPTFASATTAYTASVTNGTTSITVTPTRSEANASIIVNGIAVASGSASGNINLTVGTNTITVIVTAQDASTKTYTLTVTRAAAATPVINTTGSLPIFSSCINGISTPQSFTISGNNLLANISLVAPIGFELSATENGIFNNSIEFSPINGALSNTTVFLRFITSTVGTSSGNIILSSTGATTQNIAVSGTINPLPTVAAITGTQQVCFAATTQFASATTGGIWSSSNTSVATINAAGMITGRQAGTATISYTVTNASGCGTTVTRDIIVNALPTVTASANPALVLKGLTTQLNATGNAASYVWSPAANLSTPSQANTIARITDNTTFTVTATTAQGCVATASVSVSIKPDEIFVEPTNVFTPNGDGINDRFVIKNLDQYPNNKLQIFDRNGKVVYEQNNYANTWDGTVKGKILTKDTYFFVLTIKGQIVKRGTFTVLR